MDADGITFHKNFRKGKSGTKNNRKSINKTSESLCNQRFEGVFSPIGLALRFGECSGLKNNRKSINSVWTHSNKEGVTQFC